MKIVYSAPAGVTRRQAKEAFAEQSGRALSPENPFGEFGYEGESGKRFYLEVVRTGGVSVWAVLEIDRE